MRERKHATTTVEEIRQCLMQGMNLRQTADRLGCSLIGLRQACSLLEELNTENLPKVQAPPRAHDPFSICRH